MKVTFEVYGDTTEEILKQLSVQRVTVYTNAVMEAVNSKGQSMEAEELLDKFDEFFASEYDKSLAEQSLRMSITEMFRHDYVENIEAVDNEELRRNAKFFIDNFGKYIDSYVLESSGYLD